VSREICQGNKHINTFDLDEQVYNELTETEMLQHLNEIVLPLDEQKQIKDDVINLLDN
jgi:hypothetical protein